MVTSINHKNNISDNNKNDNNNNTTATNNNTNTVLCIVYTQYNTIHYTTTIHSTFFSHNKTQTCSFPPRLHLLSLLFPL